MLGSKKWRPGGRHFFYAHVQNLIGKDPAFCQWLYPFKLEILAYGQLSGVDLARRYVNPDLSNSDLSNLRVNLANQARYSNW